MGDAAPNPVYTPRPQTRPRRTARKPKVTYRRSPGAVSRPVPRTPPVAPSRLARLLGLAKYLPGRTFIDLFFGGVSRNAERAAATERRDIDELSRKQQQRYDAIVARLLAGPTATPTFEVSAEVRSNSAGTRLRPVAQPAPVPNPVLETVPLLSVASLSLPVPDLNFSGSQVTAQGGAPRQSVSSSPQIPNFPAQFFGNFPSLFVPPAPPIESPLLTPFNPPGAQSSPLGALFAQPLGMLDPLPEENLDRCRCRQRKRKAGKPGKGFFTIDQKGRETRRYWLNREARSHARNAS